MKANNYNYTLAEYFRPTIYIPFIGVEIHGWSILISYISACITLISVLGTGLSFVIGQNGYYIATILTLTASIILTTYLKQKDKNKGINKVEEYYYLRFKKWHFIYDSKGNRRYICPRKKGTVYVNKCM